MRAWEKMNPLEKLFYVEMEIFRKRTENKPISRTDVDLAKELRIVVQAMNPELKLSSVNPAEAPEPEPVAVESIAEVALETPPPAPEPEKPKFKVIV